MSSDEIPLVEANWHLDFKKLSTRPKDASLIFFPTDTLGDDVFRYDRKPFRRLCVRCHHWLLFTTSPYSIFGHEKIDRVQCACTVDCGNNYIISSYRFGTEEGMSQFTYRRWYSDFLKDTADCVFCARLFSHYYASRDQARAARERNKEAQHDIRLSKDFLLVYASSLNGDILRLKGSSEGDPDGDPHPLELKLTKDYDRYGIESHGVTGSAIEIDDRSDMLWPFKNYIPNLLKVEKAFPGDLPLPSFLGEVFSGGAANRLAKLPKIGHSTESPSVSISNERLALLHRWRLKCRHHHKSCQDHVQRVFASKFMPRRLIHVGSSSGSVRLVETATLPPDLYEPYATLSHCWGTVPFITLDQENYESWLKEIDMNGLTKTFQDAIRICRLLGVNFVWIDSLCIIQRSHEDWKSEAPRMAEYYGNSALTLAAAGSSTSTAGLLMPFDTLYFAQMAFTGANGNFYLEDKFTMAEELRMQLHSNPLYRRTWVVQERYLSPFQVSFSSSQMVWCCKSAIIFESMPNDNVIRAVLSEFDRNILSVEQADKQWRSVIAQYSPTRSTMHQDRAVALHGIVKSFEKNYQTLGVGTRHCAGLWEHALPEMLPWRVASLGRENYKQVLAPSWSWLNVKADVELPQRQKFNKCELLEYTINPQDPSIPFGPTKGHVHLRTHVLLAKLANYEKKEKFWSRTQVRYQDLVPWRIYHLSDVSGLAHLNFGLLTTTMLSFDEKLPQSPSQQEGVDRMVYMVVTATDANKYASECLTGPLCEMVPEEQQQQQPLPASDLEGRTPQLVLRRVGMWELTVAKEDRPRFEEVEGDPANPLMQEVLIV